MLVYLPKFRCRLCLCGKHSTIKRYLEGLNNSFSRGAIYLFAADSLKGTWLSNLANISNTPFLLYRANEVELIPFSGIVPSMPRTSLLPAATYLVVFFFPITLFLFSQKYKKNPNCSWSGATAEGLARAAMERIIGKRPYRAFCTVLWRY